MFPAALCILALLDVHAPQVESEPMLAGTWSVDSNGHFGELVIRLSGDAKVAGSIFGQPIKGTFDPLTKKIAFERLAVVKSGEGRGVQAYQGVLSLVPKSKPAQYALEGHFTSLAGPEWGTPGEKFAWKARAIRHPHPTQDLQELQGPWKVGRIIASNSERIQLPEELRLGEQDAAIAIRGNQLTVGDKVVATLANDVSSRSLEAEKGFPSFRLLVLTLPSGKGLLCSYLINEEGVEIAYPHTTFCHRGSGQIIYLRRPGL